MVCGLILEKLVVLEDNTLSCADRDIDSRIDVTGLQRAGRREEERIGDPSRRRISLIFFFFGVMFVFE